MLSGVRRISRTRGSVRKITPPESSAAERQPSHRAWSHRLWQAVDQVRGGRWSEPGQRVERGFVGDRLYLGADHSRNERRTWIVTGICGVTLVALLTGGVISRSVALLANGLHMGAHVVALLVASWALGEALRQRKSLKRRKKR